jgi:NitT/TauT family transport system permease protein
LATLLQPVVQVVASFPATMLFPLVVLGLAAAGVSLDWGSVLLMLLGTQWYILFNVIAGAMAIPADLKEAAHSYNITGWQKFWVLYFPALFPYLVTGWVTAAGGAWNASIVSEYITFAAPQGQYDQPLSAATATGLLAAPFGAGPLLAASTQAAGMAGKEEVLTAWGLGALISIASANKDFAGLAASVLAMSLLVVAFNRTVWRYCYDLAEKRFSLTK